jgi:hypothetical protein
MVIMLVIWLAERRRRPARVPEPTRLRAGPGNGAEPDGGIVLSDGEEPGSAEVGCAQCCPEMDMS